MWKQELLKNKIHAVLFIMLGALSVLIEYDATFFVFSLIFGIPLFFSKKNWIMSGEEENNVVSDKDLRRNAFGYFDPTAYEAIINVSREEKLNRRSPQHKINKKSEAKCPRKKQPLFWKGG